MPEVCLWTQWLWYGQNDVTTETCDFWWDFDLRMQIRRSASKKKEKEQYLGKCYGRIAITEKASHNSIVFSTTTNSHRLYNFYWIKFPARSLFTLLPILSPSFLAFLLSIRRSVRWHFQCETQMLPKSSCVKSNRFFDESHFKGILFFFLCTTLTFFYLSQFVWVMTINCGTKGRGETHPGDYFIYEVSLFPTLFLFSFQV